MRNRRVKNDMVRAREEKRKKKRRMYSDRARKSRAAAT